MAAANVAADSSAEDGEKNKGTPGEDKNTATAPAIKGTGEEDEDAPIPALPLDEDGNADASGAGTETSASAADASNENGTSGKTKSKKKKKKDAVTLNTKEKLQAGHLVKDMIYGSKNGWTHWIDNEKKDAPATLPWEFQLAQVTC